MNGAVVFERLNEMFRQPDVLPQLPESAMRLVQAIDAGEANNSELSHMISMDPTLAANVLRVASSAAYAGTDDRPTTVQGAVMRLGHQAVRSLAVAILVQSLLNKGLANSSFDHQKFARHSTYVALMGQYLYVQLQREGRASSKWTAEEAFAAGVLHDLSIALLAKVAPKVHDVVASYARNNNSPFESTFEELFGRPLASLGICAAEAWSLPEVFTLTLQARVDPTLLNDSPTFRDSLVVADILANQQGFSYEGWTVSAEHQPNIDTTDYISRDDLITVTRTIHREASLWAGESTRMAA